MFQKLLIFWLLTPFILSTCPTYPYFPLMPNSWEYFCEDWQLPQPANGAFRVRFKGNNLYIGLFNSPTDTTYQLRITVFNSNSFWLIETSPNNYSLWNEQSVRLPGISSFSFIEIDFNNTVFSIYGYLNYDYVIAYHDPDSLGGNYLPNIGNAQYISLGSPVLSGVVIGEECPSYPYTPSADFFSGGNWEYYCSKWFLANPGDGAISFYGQGKNIWVGIFNTYGKPGFIYAVEINITALTVGLFFDGVYNSFIDQKTFTTSNASAINKYDIYFNKSAQTISIYLNGESIYRYVDSNYGALTAKATFISFAQWDTALTFVIYTCPFASDGVLFCGTEIPNCTYYNLDTSCQICNNSKILVDNNCLSIINNCTTYSVVDGSCASCGNSTIASVDNKICAIPIENCIEYSDNDGSCAKCSNPKELSVNNQLCAIPIQYCSEYSDNNGSCLICNDPYSAKTIDTMKCVTPIKNCYSYVQEGHCFQCDSEFNLTLSGIGCSPYIPECGSYSDTVGLCLSCGSSYALTESSLFCVPIIKNCELYLDNKICKTCSSNLILSVDSLSCVSIIPNCQMYLMNGSCSSCSNPYLLSNDKITCIQLVNNCAFYNTDGLCTNCSSSFLLIANNTLCVKSIKDCQNYSINGNCSSCIAGKIISSNNSYCFPKINNCSSYNYSPNLTNGLCTSCESSFVLAANNTLCVKSIKDCQNYSINGNCSSCIAGKILSSNNSYCFPNINNCSSYNYSANFTCLQCFEGLCLSVNKTACINPISNCIQYTDDDKCILCLLGTSPSTNGSLCVVTKLPANESNQTIQSQITTSTQNTNNAISTSDPSIQITNSLNQSYSMNLSTPTVTLSSTTQTTTVTARTKAGAQTNALTVSLGSLSSVSSGSYQMTLTLAFTSTKRRILESKESQILPHYFTIEYTPLQTFFIGTDSEIAVKFAKKNPQEISISNIIAIIFSIFCFLIILAVICYCQTQRIFNKNNENLQPVAYFKPTELHTQFRTPQMEIQI